MANFVFLYLFLHIIFLPIFLGTQVCGGDSETCKSSGKVTCSDTKTYPIYDCSPPVISSGTTARLTRRDFSHGFGAECDGKDYAQTELVVAISTGWYSGGSRCLKSIGIKASNGRRVFAKVVDQCDSSLGCDELHDGAPPCGPNIVGATEAVWKGLGFPKKLTVANITWFTA